MSVVVPLSYSNISDEREREREKIAFLCVGSHLDIAVVVYASLTMAVTAMM
jgi:hypothetical protein